MNRTTEQHGPIEIEQLYRGLDAEEGGRFRQGGCCMSGGWSPRLSHVWFRGRW